MGALGKGVTVVRAGAGTGAVSASAVPQMCDETASATATSERVLGMSGDATVGFGWHASPSGPRWRPCYLTISTGVPGWA